MEFDKPNNELYKDQTNEGMSGGAIDKHPADQEIPKHSWFAKVFQNILISLIGVITLFVLIVFFTWLIPAIQEIPTGERTRITNSVEMKNDPEYKKQIAQITKDIQRLTGKYNSYTTGQSYLVINTTDNLFYLYKNKKLIREGHCSSGSYKMLKTEEGRSWIFKTPKGKFWIQGKITNPTWRRPDWAFVEEGLPIPSQDDPSRYEYGVLGDYAMALGDGYLIHGTLYKRFLGMPVTHGCVRLNDEDLEAIFHSLTIGSSVYIY
ncbi:MAG TPA: L,D-transpeptidase [Bacteroidales bacterium]|jgi:lipoprotein-anchoring transpeptidase ErfK/SrfK|nr:MAG: putative L,D-transpeptidase YnhG precursor [Bacteroidetes bacterium ADurb.Bin145]HOU01459.1 L,D-transpeptidase [Bacteroidales bacterium]HQG63052.1 L,D-transpeptidase [Bacteroidales bacterium]HQK68942.1 L,D-transpeptidase [Bacteroidales bacterium]